MVSAPLRLKRAPRPKGRDLKPLSDLELYDMLMRSQLLIDHCAHLPHLNVDDDEAQPNGRRTSAGRPLELPPELMVLFGVTTFAWADNDRKAQAFMQHSQIWEPTRAHFNAFYPAYKGLQPGSRGPSRWQFHRWYTKCAENREALKAVYTAFQTVLCDLSLRMGIADPDRHSPSATDLRDTAIADGTNVKARLSAAPGDMQVDRETGEIEQIPYDPGNTHQWRKGVDDEPVRSDAAGTPFGIVQVTTGHTEESFPVAIYEVPTGPGHSEMKASMAALADLKANYLPGIDALLYDKAAHGVDIDAALAIGVHIHARVSLADEKRGIPKQRLTDVGLPAHRDGEQVGTVDIMAIGGAAHILVHLGNEQIPVLLEPQQVHERRSRNSVAITRVWRTYGIPDDAPVPKHLRGATVDIRHNTNEADRAAGLNRAEVLRLIAEDHPDWPAVAQRNRAECMNQLIKHRWPDKRGPALGPERKRLRLMFGTIAIAVQAAVRFEQRTGIEVLPAARPPTIIQAAA